MKVICPKCQFENQADSARVVCGRCATIIQVKLDQGTISGDGATKRQTARLPFSNGNGNSGPLNHPSGPSAPLSAPTRDVYATRLGEEFDNVLDLPGPPPTNYQTSVEPAPVFDDVFSMPPAPSYDSNTNYNFSAYDKRPTAPVENGPGATASQRITQDYAATPDPEFMGWPMLPENSLEDDDDGGSYATQRSGVLARVALIVLAFGVLSFLAYYFLWDYIAKRKDQLANAGVTQVEERSSQPAGNADRANNRIADTLPPKAVATPPLITPKPQESVAPAPNAGQTGNMKEFKVTPAPAELKGPDGHSRTANPASKPAPVAPVAAPPAASAPKTPSRGNLTIQVGSFNDRAQADGRAAELRSAGAEARVVTANIPGKGTWYRVQVGGFESREAANSYAGQLRAKGRIQDFIVTSK